jgi:hypothetical protein
MVIDQRRAKKKKKHVPRESMKLSTSIAFLSIFWPKILSTQFFENSCMEVEPMDIIDLSKRATSL